MKNSTLKFCSILILLFSFGCQNNPAQKESKKFSNKFCKEMEKKYCIFCYDYGSKMKYNIIDIPFTSFDRLNVDEARVLYVNIMEQFLNDVNHDVNIRPYLQPYPLNTTFLKRLIKVKPSDK